METKNSGIKYFFEKISEPLTIATTARRFSEKNKAKPSIYSIPIGIGLCISSMALYSGSVFDFYFKESFKHLSTGDYVRSFLFLTPIITNLVSGLYESNRERKKERLGSLERLISAKTQKFKN